MDIECIGPYKDDGLAVSKTTVSELERTRKLLTKKFQDHSQSITSQANIASATFSDMTLRLRTESYKQHSKLNNLPLYISKHSSYPSHIIKSLPETI